MAGTQFGNSVRGMGPRPAAGRVPAKTPAPGAIAKPGALLELRSILKGAAFAALGLLLSKIFLYLTRVVVARQGPDTYGLYSLAMLTANFVFLVSVLGVDQALLSYVSIYSGAEEPGKIRSVVKAGLGIVRWSSLAIAAILFAAAPFIASSVFHDPRLYPLLQLVAICVPFTAYTIVAAAIFRAFKRVDLETLVRSVIENVAKLAFITAFIAGMGAYGGVLGYVAGSVVAAAAAFVLMRGVLPDAAATNYPRREILSLSVPLASAAIAYAAIPWVASTALGILRNTAEVGFLNTITPTGELMLVIPTMLVTLFVPAMGRLVGLGDKAQAKAAMSHVSKWIFIGSLPFALLLSYYASQVLSVLFGPEYAPAAGALVIVVAGYFAYSICLPSLLMLQTLRKTREINISMLIGLLVIIALGFTLPARWGYYGSAVAIAAAMAAYGLAGAVLARWQAGVVPYSSYHPQIAISAITAMAVLHFAQGIAANHPLWEMAFLAAIYAAVYLPLLGFFKCFDATDGDILHSILRRLPWHAG